MGTNYYWYGPKCSQCDRREHLHIGKSSGGWAFALHIYPDRNINELSDWAMLFLKDGSEIKDEYGRQITFDEMVKLTQQATVPWVLQQRNSIDGIFCVGYSTKGNCDLCIGEFA